MTFLPSKLSIELSSQNKSVHVRIYPIKPCKFDASTVRPKSMPSKTKKKIYSIKLRFISSMALGRK